MTYGYPGELCSINKLSCMSCFVSYKAIALYDPKSIVRSCIEILLHSSRLMVTQLIQNIEIPPENCCKWVLIGISKGLKKVANIQPSAMLHPYFILSYKSTTIRMNLQQMKYIYRIPEEQHWPLKTWQVQIIGDEADQSQNFALICPFLYAGAFTCMFFERKYVH